MELSQGITMKKIKWLCYLTFLCTLPVHAAQATPTNTTTNVNNTSTQLSCSCTHTINQYSGVIDGDTLGFQPGDTICLDASVTYSYMKWENINGTQADPITIKNCGGQVHINAYVPPSNSTHLSRYGWKFHNSSFFKITGDGDPQHQYGIKVSTPGGYHMKMEKFTTNFSISNVEIAGNVPVTGNSLSGFAGIGVKTDPTCDGLSDRGVWEMRDVRIHDNYIHDVGTEGLYIGYGRYDGFFNNDCPLSSGGHRFSIPHAIKGLRVFNNKIDNVGWDGIQVKNADHDAEIYNNVITNYGLRENGNHDEGLFIGDGSEALIYNNWVDNGPGVKKGHGIQINGFGNTKIFNNVVINLGVDEFRPTPPPGTSPAYNKKSSIYINNNSSSYSVLKGGTFEVYNNTFVGAQDYGIEAFTPQPIDIKNNIFTGYALNKESSIDHTPSLLTWQNASNIFDRSGATLNFIDAVNKDFHLQPSSSAVGAGVNRGLAFDHDGTSRLVDQSHDIGAYEYDSSGPQISIVTPSTNIQLTSNDVFVDEKSVFIEVDLIDPNSLVQRVEYFLNGRFIGLDRLPRTLEHHIGGQRFNVGVNNFYAVAVDLNGQRIQSQSITITIL